MQDRLYGCDNNWLDYLAHHGVKGQSWGVQNGPPYPLDRAGKKALREQKKAAKIEAKQEAIRKKKRAAQLEAVRKAKRIAAENKRREEEALKKEELEKREFEENKSKALMSGDVKFGYKYRDMLSKKEIDDLINKYETNNKLAKINNAILNSGKNSSNKILNKLDKMGTTIEDMANVIKKFGTGYDTFAKVYNSLMKDGDKKALPTLNLGNASNKNNKSNKDDDD